MPGHTTAAARLDIRPCPHALRPRNIPPNRRLVKRMSGWLEVSQADSDRFGLIIVRGQLDADYPDHARLGHEIAHAMADIAIVRVPAGDTLLVHSVLELGMVPLHADTLVYYERALDRSLRDVPLPAGLSIELAGVDDKPAVAEIARKGFGAYRSHYHANLLLDPRQIADGYAQWATGCVSAEVAGHETWVARLREEIVGFVTCRLDDDVAEILLNAVDPAHRGQGVYGSLLRHLLRHCAHRGLRKLEISTQVWNYTVQRAWSREGLLLTRAYDTYHINLRRAP